MNREKRKIIHEKFIILAIAYSKQRKERDDDRTQSGKR